MTPRLAPLLLGVALLVAPGCDSSGIGAELAALELLFGCDVAEVSVGDRATGRLSADDCSDETLLDGRFAEEDEDYYFDLFAFEVEDATEVEVALSSASFDTILGLFSETGTLLDSDDDGGSGTDSFLSADLAPGIYLIIVSTFDAEETGAYSLGLRRGTGGAALRTAEPTARRKGDAWVGR